MRGTILILLAAVFGLADAAMGFQPGCASCNKSTTTQYALDAGPCGSPCGYGLAVGCCEPRRHCCDNAWAGYCDHRARVDAFWAQVGTPGYCGRGKCSRPVALPCSESCGSCAIEPGCR